MSGKSASFEVNPDRGTVRLEVVETDRRGRVRRRSQHTFRLYQFTAALRTADIVVPWERVKS